MFDHGLPSFIRENDLMGFAKPPVIIHQKSYHGMVKMNDGDLFLAKDGRMSCLMNYTLRHISVVQATERVPNFLGARE